MKIIKTLALLFMGFVTLPAFASVTPSVQLDKNPGLDLRKIKTKEIERLTGKKLSFFEKLQLKILQKKLIKFEKGEPTAKQKKQGTLSMLCGFVSFIVLFISPLVLLAIPFGVLALVFGIQSLKGNSNAKAILGVVTGGLSILLFLVALAIVAAMLAGGG